jgi:hypothetical protein
LLVGQDGSRDRLWQSPRARQCQLSAN